MDVALAAAITYAVMAAYLAARGVPPRRIGRILLMGLAGGAALSATLGVIYFLVVVHKPAQTFAVFAIVALLASAAREARHEILGSITPLGLIFLNIAVNFAPWPGPMPLSLAPLTQLVPLPPGMARTAANLLLLYAPALAAVLLIRGGPPGNSVLRFLLGAWVCYVGIAMMVGPGWAALRGFQASDPSRWLAAALASFAAVHVVMLALNLLGSVSGNDGDAAHSIARSVQVDSFPLKLAGLAATGFWIAAFIFRRATIALEFELTSAALVGGALGLGAVLARAPGLPSQEDHAPRGSVAFLGPLALAIGVVAVIGAVVWNALNPQAQAIASAPVNPATGQVIEVQPTQAASGLAMHYPEADLHAELKMRLGKHGVPFTLQRIGGREYIRVEEAYREPAQKAIEEIEGPRDTPRNNIGYKDPAAERAFTDWLDAHNVGWRKVRRRYEHYLTWDEGPNSNWLPSAFSEEQSARSAGVDYFALYVVRQEKHPNTLDGAAAFRSPEHQQRFVAWLKAKGVAPRIVERNGASFVEWTPPSQHLLQEYVMHARSQCFEAERARAPNGVVPQGRC